MALVERAIPVGGASLNFAVVGGTTQPTNPKENTIWVNTATAIGEWQFSATQPTKRADGSALAVGDVWIKTSASNGLEFNALKKNGIMLSPGYCYQWGGTSWISRETLTYKDGAWNELALILFYKGTFAGGYIKDTNFHTDSYYSVQGTLTVGDTIQMSVPVNGEVAIVFDPIDCTDFSQMVITVNSANLSGKRMGLATQPTNTYANCLVKSDVNAVYSGEVVIDISEVEGKYYPFIGMLRSHSQISETFTVSKVELR